MKFLVKEIRSKTGVLHFRRWRILELPWFRIYVHNICKADEDKHEHTHPWSFLSFVLKGGYEEISHWHWIDPLPHIEVKKPLGPYYTHYNSSHKLRHLFGNTWTLVFSWGKKKPWGYNVGMQFVDHETYRKNKNEGKYNEESREHSCNS